MSLYRRGKIWHVRFSIGGRRVRRSTGTDIKALAQEYHDRLKGDLWRQVRLGEKPPRTWKEAVVEWCKSKSSKKTLQRDIEKLRWLDQFLGDLWLDQIDTDLLDEIVDARLDAESKSPATVNRWLALVRAVLRRAHKRRWLASVPLIPMQQEGEGRVRWLTCELAALLVSCLPAAYRLPARLSLSTGLRRSNCLALRRDHVDMSRGVAWVDARESKNGKAFSVPLNNDAIQILREAWEQNPVGPYVFSSNDHPLPPIDRGDWLAACEQAKINDFRWHDLRHTWASWHVMAGTSLQELMALGGWRSINSVLRYAHLSADHLKVAAGRIEESTLSIDEDAAQGDSFSKAERQGNQGLRH